MLTYVYIYVFIIYIHIHLYMYVYIYFEYIQSLHLRVNVHFFPSADICTIRYTMSVYSLQANPIKREFHSY